MSAEDLLTRTFAEVTDHTEYPTTSVATIAARSRAIRSGHRRRVAYVAAAAVVLVGGLSAGLALGGGDADGPPAPAGPLGNIRQGPAPRIGYLEGDTYITTSGQRFTSRALAKAEDAVAWRNGVLVAGRPTSRHPYSTISFVSGGATSSLGCGTPNLVVPSDGGDPVYWLASGCDLDQGGRFVQGSASTDTSMGAHFTPVGQVAGGLVVAASGTRLRVPADAVVIPPGNKPWIPLPLLLPRAATEGGNLVTGPSRNGSGDVVVDASTGDVKWRARSWTLSKFSSSGRYVVGDQEVGKQPEPDVGDVIGIFDAASGDQVLRKELPGLTFDTLPIWEGDDAVLVVAEDDRGREAIVRVTLDGTVTRATGVVQWTPRPATGRPPIPWFRPGATP